MRFLNRYLVVALFVVGLMSSGGFMVSGNCFAAMKKCQTCRNVHDDQIGCKDERVKLCTECKRVHDSRINCKEAARLSQSGAKQEAGGGGKAATFKVAFTGAGASRVGNLTAGLSVIQSQAANMMSKSNFGPSNYNYNYGGYNFK